MGVRVSMFKEIMCKLEKLQADLTCLRINHELHIAEHKAYRNSIRAIWAVIGTAIAATGVLVSCWK